MRHARAVFRSWVEDAWSSIPESIREQFSNLVIAVEDEPTHEQLETARVPPGDTLLGLYEGVPLKSRGWHYQMALPDQITLFQGPLERMAGPEVRQAIYETLWHELAHHIGMTEAEVQQAERRKFG